MTSVPPPFDGTVVRPSISVRVAADGKPGKLGMLVSGGPAPGINSVIGAATIRARLSGVEVIGILDGFRYIQEGDTSMVMPLEIHGTSRIHFRGGSHIGISRGSPIGDPERMRKTLQALRELGITMLITIGGDGTAYVASKLADAAIAEGAELRVVHVPKTIDNDIALPDDIPTFGYQTARHVGVEIVENLMVDARATHRFYLVVAQGRKSGHLALAIGKAAGATLTLIPEEFRPKTPLSAIVDTLVAAMIKRTVDGNRTHGVFVCAEGLAEVLDLEELAKHTDLPVDARGNLSLADISLADVLEKAVRKRAREVGLSITIQSKEVGYELRCADPIPFDMEYTRDLGYLAARHILEGGDRVMVSMQDGKFTPIPFAALMDPTTGRTKVRMVDLSSDRYRIARTYMVRLRRSDLIGESCTQLAKACRMSESTFRAEFGAIFNVEHPLVANL
jgi:ATP-dependent phosphofructokinase / diphosphate-dependent phosphofructokinase